MPGDWELRPAAGALGSYRYKCAEQPRPPQHAPLTACDACMRTAEWTAWRFGLPFLAADVNRCRLRCADCASCIGPGSAKRQEGQSASGRGRRAVRLAQVAQGRPAGAAKELPQQQGVPGSTAGARPRRAVPLPFQALGASCLRPLAARWGSHYHPYDPPQQGA